MISQGDKGSREGKGKAGYEYLLAYKITVPIYDYTVVFCTRAGAPDLPNLPNHPNFPKLSSKRTFDQMVQSARSGSQNMPEGNQQASLEGYIKLTGVNIGSLDELLKDYKSYARQNQLEIWPKEKVGEIRELGEVWGILKATPTLPNYPNFPHLPNGPTVAVNLMITLVNQAIYLQKKLLKSLEEKFIHEGGFRENLFKKRLDHKRQTPSADGETATP